MIIFHFNQAVVLSFSDFLLIFLRKIMDLKLIVNLAKVFWLYNPLVFDDGLYDVKAFYKVKKYFYLLFINDSNIINYYIVNLFQASAPFL